MDSSRTALKFQHQNHLRVFPSRYKDSTPGIKCSIDEKKFFLRKFPRPNSVAIDDTISFDCSELNNREIFASIALHYASTRCLMLIHTKCLAAVAVAAIASA